MPGIAKHDLTARRAEDAEATRDKAVRGQTERVPRILCIDDEPAMLTILTRALGSRFDVVTLEDPLAALALLERAGDFSVVISDLRMPQMDGAELLARARKIAPSTTRLALTACLERQLTSEEAFGILTKPCPIKLLHESVTAAVQRHALLQRMEAVSTPESLGALALGPTELPDRVTGSEIRARRPNPGGRDQTLPTLTGQEASAISNTRLYLRLLGKRTEIGPRATLLGRSPDCDIVINDPRVEPRHVRFFNSWRGVTLQDLSRASNVRVNGQAFTGVRHTVSGDWISIGPFHAEVQSPRSDQAPSQDRAAAAEESPLAMLGAVAEKFFLLGQSVEAERILRPRLEELEIRCRQLPLSSRRECDTAAALAARLAAELRAPGWIDYIFRVFTALGRPLDASMVEILQGVMRQVPGASLGGFREYLRVLAAAQADFSPAEQLASGRIESLELLIR